jgi:hypothetical protein
MKFTPVHLIALVGVIGAVIAFDRWSGREDRWRERLANAVQEAKQGDSLQHVRDSLRHTKDSTEQAALIAKADSEEATHLRLARENGKLRVQLAQAPTLPDTVRVQARIIVQQDSIIASDSAQKVTLRQTIAKKDETIIDLNASLTDTRRRLADLIAVADKPPKEFKFLGLNLSLKPYIGVGLNVSPQAKVNGGLQLGVSILRG